MSIIPMAYWDGPAANSSGLGPLRSWAGPGPIPKSLRFECRKLSGLVLIGLTFCRKEERSMGIIKRNNNLPNLHTCNKK